MSEQLQQRATSIIEILRRQPERGADLLIDFAQQYGADAQVEDDAIIAKLHWMLAEEESEKKQALQALEATNATRILLGLEPIIFSSWPISSFFTRPLSADTRHFVYEFPTSRSRINSDTTQTHFA